MAVGTLVLIHAVRLLPLSICRKLGRLMGYLGYLVFRRRRALAMENVGHAFGDTISEADKRKIVRGAFENLGIVGLEFPHLHQLLKPKNKHLVNIRGIENLEHDRGTLITCAHLSNWEWMAPPLIARGYRIAEVVNTYKDPYHERALNAARSRGGIITISKVDAVRSHIRLLSQGTLVGIVSDQSPRQNGVPAKMFGRTCWATPGPAVIALRTGAPLHHATMWRNADETYTIEISPRIEFESTGDHQRDIQTLTQHIQMYIEAGARKYPEQWLWTHDRWKRRPDAEAAWGIHGNAEPELSNPGKAHHQ